MSKTKTGKPECLLTVDETAQVIKSSPKTIRRLIDAGDLPHVRIGRLVRVRPEDLDRFIKARLI